MININNELLIFEKRGYFSNDVNILEQIGEIALASYANHSGLLERDISYCKEIYMLKNDAGQIIAYFMVRFERIESTDTYFLGWSACRNTYKGKGCAKFLYNSFFVDCKMKEAELNTKILCWWTTATPIAFHWFNLNAEKCEPDLEGRITEEGRNMLTKIVRSKFRNTKLDEANPFLLRGYAEKTHYSTSEREKLSKVANFYKIKAFDDFPIDENNGDRYLMIGYAPDLNILRQRL